MLKNVGDVAAGAFDDMRKFEFTSAESAASLNQLLAPLAAMTNHPPLLRIVAMVLLREVVELNAPTTGKGGSAGSDGRLNTQAWERNAIMAPLLGVTTYLDPVRARKACQGAAVEGPLPAALLEVTGYPRNRYACCACMCGRTSHAHMHSNTSQGCINAVRGSYTQAKFFMDVEFAATTY